MDVVLASEKAALLSSDVRSHWGERFQIPPRVSPARWLGEPIGQDRHMQRKGLSQPRDPWCLGTVAAVQPKVTGPYRCEDLDRCNSHPKVAQSHEVSTAVERRHGRLGDAGLQYL